MTIHPTRYRLVALGFIPFIALALVPLQAGAQTSGAAPRVSFTVAGGINIARISVPFDDSFAVPEVEISNGRRVGFNGGLFAGIPLGRRLAFDTGALVSARGARMEATSPLFGSGTSDLRMIYLDVPLFLRAPLAAAGNQRLSLLAGGMFGARLSARMRAEAAGQSNEMTITDELPAADFGLTLGGRVDAGRGVVLVYYTFGLSDLAKGEAPSAIRHRILTVLGGFRF